MDALADTLAEVKTETPSNALVKVKAEEQVEVSVDTVAQMET